MFNVLCGRMKRLQPFVGPQNTFWSHNSLWNNKSGNPLYLILKHEQPKQWIISHYNLFSRILVNVFFNAVASLSVHYLLLSYIMTYDHSLSLLFPHLHLFDDAHLRGTIFLYLRYRNLWLGACILNKTLKGPWVSFS